MQVAQFDYSELRDKIYALKEKYPFATYGVCGRSLAGRAIYTLGAGDRSNASLYVGGVHGSEWMTCLVLLRFFENICSALQNETEMSGIRINNIFQERGIIIVPCLNPDGMEICMHGAESAGCYANTVREAAGKDKKPWSANAAGVDINHNFNAGWYELHKMEQECGITGPAPKQYGGKSPESEPETSALVRLCNSRDIRHAIALHSQGEEIYWQYGEKTPQRAEMMARIFAASSGYTLVTNAGLASHGGFKDWFIRMFDRPAFTIEIGRGENPLPIEQLDSIYADVEEMLTLSSIM